MIPAERKPPMLARTARSFPIKIEDPEAVFKSHRFVEDIEVLGLTNVDVRTLARAVCTIGSELEDFIFQGETTLDAVVLGDRYTSWLIYENEIEYQIEFFLDGKGFTNFNKALSGLNKLTRSNKTRLLVIADIAPSGSEKEYIKENDDVEYYPVIAAPEERLKRF